MTLRLEGITKRYGDLTVFENFSLETEPGTVVCITGPSGCGKTTLLNIISSLTGPDSGRVVFDESEKGPVSYLFQEPRLLPWKTALENCVFVCDDRSRARHYLELAGLGGKLDSYPSGLSGGERQRVAFARAFCYRSEVILMDEPFQNLDEKLKESMASVFFDILEKDRRSVIWVSHDLDLAKRYARRIVDITSR